MKVLATVAALALSTAAFAASNSSVNDLQYLPNAGTLFGDTSFNYLKYSDREFDGTNDVKFSTKGFLIRQTAGYALRDNFSLALNLGYQNTKSESTGTDDHETSGLNDVELFAKYRLIDTENRLDILGQVTISPGDSEVDDDEGNAYSGGHKVSVGADYGMKKANYQWSLRALYTYHLKATTEDKVLDEKIKDDAHSSLALQAQLLSQLGEKCFIRTFAGVDFEQEYDDNNDSTTMGNTRYNLGGEYQHLMSQDLYLRAGFTTVISGNGYNSVVPVYHIGAGYQF